jgi:hypothetical protein
MKTKENRSTLMPNDKKLCRLYQKLGEFTRGMDRLPDAQEVKKQWLTSVPVQFLPMVFLRQQFLPLYEPTGKVPKRGQAETAFFESLEILTVLYGFAITGIEDKPYPLNVLYAHHQLEKQLTASGQEIEVSIVKDDGTVKLMTSCQYATASTPYYITVL